MAIHYRQILELHAQELVQRDIAAITGNSRPKISEVIKQAELHQISPPFTDDVDDIWLESLLFPQKQPMVSRGTLFRRPIFKIIRRNLPLFRRFFLRFDDFSIPILHYIPATVSSHRNRPADADLLTVLS